jgi:gas vesicle protein
MSNERNPLLEIAVALAIGVGAGYLIGILFAPAGGEKTRKMIQEEINKTGDKAKELFEKIVK